jgi:hypothetical protein
MDQSVVDLFTAYRRADGREPTAQAVQLSRLNQIAAARTLPMIWRSREVFEEKLAQLTPTERDYVLRRLSEGMPAVASRIGPAGKIDQVWFPVQLDEPGVRELLAQEQRQGTQATQRNIVASRERLDTLLDTRQVGAPVMESYVGGAYGVSMWGRR